MAEWSPPQGRRRAAAVALGHFALHPPKLFFGLWQCFPPVGWMDTNVKNEFCKVVRKRHTTEKGILKRHVEIISRKKKKKYKWTIKPEEKNVRLTSKRNAG